MVKDKKEKKLIRRKGKDKIGDGINEKEGKYARKIYWDEERRNEEMEAVRYKGKERNRNKRKS